MTVNPDRAAGTVDHDGTTYYFCSKSCVAKFAGRPEEIPRGHARADARAAGPHDRRLEEGAASPQPLAPTVAASARQARPSPGPEPGTVSPSQPRPGTDWVCPMDPEVVSDRPGPCPKCGMALEPRVADLTDAPNPELVDMSRRFWIGVVLGAPVFLLDDGRHGERRNAQPPHRHVRGELARLALATPVVFWCGWPFFHRMWHSIVNASPNMFTLIGMGVGAAYGYSAARVVVSPAA